jgi:hypothetical protein
MAALHAVGHNVQLINLHSNQSNLHINYINHGNLHINQDYLHINQGGKVTYPAAIIFTCDVTSGVQTGWLTTIFPYFRKRNVTEHKMCV